MLAPATHSLQVRRGNIGENSRKLEVNPALFFVREIALARRPCARASLRRRIAPPSTLKEAPLLAQRDDLTTPYLSPKTQAQREAELTQLNGKLYTVAKAQFDMKCPAVATGPTGSVVHMTWAVSRGGAPQRV